MNPKSLREEIDPDAPPSLLNLIGSACLGFAALVVLASIASKDGKPLPMLRSFYTDRTMWYFAAFFAFVVGCRLLRQPAANHAASEPAWQPQAPGRRFSTFRFYTRQECHLCDDAARLLDQYSSWLPEREVIDIDADPELASEFNTCVPVVELDGKIRFRGKVNEALLRRLIEGTPVGDTA